MVLPEARSPVHWLSKKGLVMAAFYMSKRVILHDALRIRSWDAVSYGLAESNGVGGRNVACTQYTKVLKLRWLG